jgi:SAM-dependent methyltransferase
VPVISCRFCGNSFFDEPLLSYKNMPKAAQFMPDFESLGSEKGIDLDVYQCSGCGLVQLNSDPVHYYREVIRASAFSDEMKSFRISQFTEFVKKYSLQNKKFIEIGCGRGEYLSILKLTSVDAYGLEFSPESVEYCQNLGVCVSKGFVQHENEKLNNGPFDGFCILSFLEHLPEPNTVLRGIYNNLNDGAIGLIEVPNFDMIVRNKLFSEFIGDHLFYFTINTLKQMLTLNGFDVIEIKEVWHDYIISAVVRKKSKIELEDFYNYQNKIKRDIENFIDRFSKKQVAIWGASHQALAIISLTDIKEKIKYVVDSATFKQGKYTPATHIPIVAPDMLIKEPVDAIIVMAASYSDEVARIIRKEFSAKIAIAVLRENGLETIL